MGISRQAAVTVSNPGNGTTPRTIAYTNNAGTNTVLVVTVQFAGNGTGGGGVSGITYNGVALTRPTNGQGKSSTWGGAEIWYLKAPATGSNNLVVTMAASSGFFIVGIQSLDGVDQTTILRALPSPVTATLGTTSSITIASITNTDWLVDSLSIDGTGHTAGVTGTGQAKDYAVETAASDTTGGSSNTQTPSTGVMSWSWTTTKPHSQVAAAFIAAVSSTPPRNQPILQAVNRASTY